MLFVAIFYGIVGDLGARPGRAAPLHGQPGAAQRAGDRQGAGVERARPCAGDRRLRLRALLGIGAELQPATFSGGRCSSSLASALFSTFSLIIACIVKTRDRFMGIGQLLTMPIFFASNAIYPIDLMPAWLRAIPPPIR